MVSFILDQSSYKDVKTSRGLNYHYYCAAPKDEAKPYLLFLHGFPSTSRDWKRQIDFFQPQGYGIIAPDLLGYAGTDKPKDADAYRMKHMVADVIDILNAEKVERVIAIAHDWGSALCSRLANYHQDRFIGFAFLALNYFPPSPDFDIEALNALSFKEFGYTNFGYWTFFAREDAAQIIESHINAFFSLGYSTGDPELWKEHFCTVGSLEKWLKADRTGNPTISAEEFDLHIEELKKNGFASPLNWYKAFVYKLTPKDDAEIPKEKYQVAKPVFYAACLKDAACVAAIGKHITAENCPNATVVEYDVGHWVTHEATDKLNKDLQNWVENILSADQSKA